MAKYNVIQHSTSLLDNGNGYLNIYVLCELKNSGGNLKIFKFRIAPDSTYPDINALNSIINNGLSYAAQKGLKIEYSEFADRMYLNFSLPTLTSGALVPYRFTGEKLIYTRSNN